MSTTSAWSGKFQAGSRRVLVCDDSFQTHIASPADDRLLPGTRSYDQDSFSGSHSVGLDSNRHFVADSAMQVDTHPELIIAINICRQLHNDLCQPVVARHLSHVFDRQRIGRLLDIFHPEPLVLRFQSEQTGSEKSPRTK